MKHFIVLGMLFLPSIYHLILYIFKRDPLFLKTMTLGVIGMLNILTVYTEFSALAKVELHTALTILLTCLVYLLYFEVQQGNPSQLSKRYLAYASKLYTIAGFLIVTGAAALTGLISLPISGYIYFLAGFFGIQFVFLWKLKLVESTQADEAGSKNDHGKPKEIVLEREDHKLLTLLLQGKTDKEISESLFRSQPAIKKQLSALYKKIKVKNRTEAALYYKKTVKKDL